jgi:hypothetical protein
MKPHSIIKILGIYATVTLVFASLSFGKQAPADNKQNSTSGLKEEISALSPLLGQWSCDGTFASNGKPISSTMAFSPTLEGAWVEMHQDDRPPNLFHAHELWGFDKAAKEFTNFAFDNFGGVRKFTSPGWSGNQIIWTGEPSTQLAHERFIFERASSATLVVTWQVRRGEGDWVLGDKLTCSAQK